MKVYLYVLALITATGLLALVDLPSLLKKKARKELFLVISLFSIGFILNLMLIIGLKLPNPNKLIVSAVQLFLK